MAKAEGYAPNPNKPSNKEIELGTKIYKFIFEKDADSVRSQAFSDLVDLEAAKLKDLEMQHQAEQIKNYTHSDYFKTKRKYVKEEGSKSFVTKLTLSWKIKERMASDPEYKHESEACSNLIEPFINERKWLPDEPRSRTLHEETKLITKAASIAYLKGIKRK